MKIQKFVNELQKDKYCGDKLLLLLQYQPDIRWPITSPSSGSKMGWILPESDSNFKKGQIWIHIKKIRTGILSKHRQINQSFVYGSKTTLQFKIRFFSIFIGHCNWFF